MKPIELKLVPLEPVAIDVAFLILGARPLVADPSCQFETFIANLDRWQLLVAALDEAPDSVASFSTERTAIAIHEL